MASSSPMAMASSARDQIQSSARELLRNLECVLNSAPNATGTVAQPSKSSQPQPPVPSTQPLTTISTMGTSSTATAASSVDRAVAVTDGPAAAAASIEHAFRFMFGACTSHADISVHPDSASASGSRELSSSRSRSAPALSRSFSSLSKSLPALSNRVDKHARSNPSQHRDFGEHIYEHLFYDDQMRAEKAVQSLRGTRDGSSPLHVRKRRSQGSSQPLQASPLPPEQRTRSLPKSRTQATTIPKPFAASSPVRAVPSSRFMPSATLPAQSAPLTHDEVNISLTNNVTFDDGISAISAHTLEAMYQAQHPSLRSARSRSQNSKSTMESSLFPTSLSDEAEEQGVSVRIPSPPPGQAKRSTLGASWSPFDCKDLNKPNIKPLPRTPKAPQKSTASTPSPTQTSSHLVMVPRIRSSTTWGSRNTKNSGRTSRSPASSEQNTSLNTTTDGSFEVWENQEQIYWQQVVHEDTAAANTTPKYRMSQAHSMNLSPSTKKKTSLDRKPPAKWKTHPNNHNATIQSSSSSSFLNNRSLHDRTASTADSTTLSSSAWSSSKSWEHYHHRHSLHPSSSQRHPHETFWLEPADLLVSPSPKPSNRNYNNSNNKSTSNDDDNVSFWGEAEFVWHNGKAVPAPMADRETVMALDITMAEI